MGAALAAKSESKKSQAAPREHVFQGGQEFKESAGATAGVPLFLSRMCGGFGCDEGVQPKLELNQPGDVFEQHADYVANAVTVGEVDNAAVPAAPAPASSIGTSGIPTEDSGQPLPTGTRQRVENTLGADLTHVRVHSGENDRAMAAGIGAKAFTHGQHIWLGPQESSNDTNLMAHEAAHVVQQGAAGGKAPAVQRRAGPSYNSRCSRGRAPPVAAHQAIQTKRSALPMLRRKCACGGSCSSCAARAEEQTGLQRKETTRPFIQRSCSGCGARQDETLIQRKCACGGTCSSCAQQQDETVLAQRKPYVQREAPGSEDDKKPSCPKAPTGLGKQPPDPPCYRPSYVPTHEVARYRFCLDSDQLLPTETLDSLDSLANDPKRPRLYVIGHASSEGESGYNFNLSCHRAVAISKELGDRIRRNLLMAGKNDKQADQEAHDRVTTGARGATSEFPGGLEANRVVLVFSDQFAQPPGKEPADPECTEASRHIGDVEPEIPCDPPVPGPVTYVDDDHNKPFYFCLDSDGLTKENTPNDMVAFAHRQAATAKFRIHGYASKEGAEDYNQRLSCHRALRVAREMMNGGVPQEQIIQVTAYGATDLFDPTRGHEDRNRVAWVLVEGGEIRKIEEPKADPHGRSDQDVLKQALANLRAGQYRLGADAYISYWTCGHTPTVRAAVDHLYIKLPKDNSEPGPTYTSKANGREEDPELGRDTVELSTNALRCANPVECVMGRLTDMAFHHAILDDPTLADITVTEKDENNEDVTKQLTEDKSLRHHVGLHLIYLAGLGACRGRAAEFHKDTGKGTSGIDKPDSNDPLKNATTPACVRTKQPTRALPPAKGDKGGPRPSFEPFGEPKYDLHNGKLTDVEVFEKDAGAAQTTDTASNVIDASADVWTIGDKSTYGDYEVGFIQTIIKDQTVASYANAWQVIHSLPVPIRAAQLRGEPAPAEPWTSSGWQRADASGNALNITASWKLNTDFAGHLAFFSKSAGEDRLDFFHRETSVAIWLAARRIGAPLDRFSVKFIDGKVYNVVEDFDIDVRRVRGELENVGVLDSQQEREHFYGTGTFTAQETSATPADSSNARLLNPPASEISLALQRKRYHEQTAPEDGLSVDEFKQVVREILDTIQIYKDDEQMNTGEGATKTPRLGFEFAELTIVVPITRSSGRFTGTHMHDIRTEPGSDNLLEVDSPVLGSRARAHLQIALALRLHKRDYLKQGRSIALSAAAVKTLPGDAHTGFVRFTLPPFENKREGDLATLDENMVLDDMAEMYNCTLDTLSMLDGREFGAGYWLDRDKKLHRYPENEFLMSEPSLDCNYTMEIPCNTPRVGMNVGSVHTHPGCPGVENKAVTAKPSKGDYERAKLPICGRQQYLVSNGVYAYGTGQKEGYRDDLTAQVESRRRAHPCRQVTSPDDLEKADKKRKNKQQDAEDEIQPKLEIGQPGDIYEQHADQIAQAATSGQTQPSQPRAPPAPQASDKSSIPAADAGSPLAPKVRARVEPALGADLSHVRVHSAPEDREVARDLQAKAFTHGNHIWLGPNQSGTDANLMAHEAAHVVQQGAAREEIPSIQRREERGVRGGARAAVPANDPVLQDMLSDVPSGEGRKPDKGAGNPDPAEYARKKASLHAKSRPAEARAKRNLPKLAKAAEGAKKEAVKPADPHRATGKRAPKAHGKGKGAGKGGRGDGGKGAIAAGHAPPVTPPAVEPPRINPIADAAGKALRPDVQGDAKILGLAAMAQAMRLQGFVLRQRAALERQNASIIQGNMHIVHEGIAHAEEGIAKSEEHLAYRREVTSQTGTALHMSEQKADMVASQAPGLSARSEGAHDKSGPIASEAGNLASENASKTPDDEDGSAKSREQGQQLNQTASNLGSIDSAVAQTKTRADGLSQEAARAKQTNAKTGQNVATTQGTLDQTQGKLAQMTGQNAAGHARVNGLASGPGHILAGANVLDHQGLAAIQSSIQMEQRIHRAQQNYEQGMRSVPASKRGTDGKGRTGVVQRQPAPGAPERINLNLTEHVVNNVPTWLTGEQRQTEEERARLQAADIARRESEVAEINAKAGGDFTRLTAADKTGIALSLTARHLFHDVASVNWPNFAGKLLQGLIDPRVSLMGIVSGLSMVLSGAANLLSLEQWRRDPLGNLLKSAADIATGIAIILGSIAGLALAIIAILVLAAIFSFGALGPLAAAVIPFCWTVAGTVGPWAIDAAWIALELNALVMIKDLIAAATSTTASDLQTQSDHLTEDTKNAGNMALQIGMAKAGEFGARALANTGVGQAINAHMVGNYGIEVLPPAAAPAETAPVAPETAPATPVDTAPPAQTAPGEAATAAPPENAPSVRKETAPAPTETAPAPASEKAPEVHEQTPPAAETTAKPAAAEGKPEDPTTETKSTESTAGAKTEAPTAEGDVPPEDVAATEKTADGEVKVTKEGECLVCSSPCVKLRKAIDKILAGTDVPPSVRAAIDARINAIGEMTSPMEVAVAGAELKAKVTQAKAAGTFRPEDFAFEQPAPRTKPVEQTEPEQTGEKTYIDEPSPDQEEIDKRAKFDEEHGDDEPQQDGKEKVSDRYDKPELQESGWLKKKLPNVADRRKFMKWLEAGHAGGPHEHLEPGSPAAEAAFDDWFGDFTPEQQARMSSPVSTFDGPEEDVASEKSSTETATEEPVEQPAEQQPADQQPGQPRLSKAVRDKLGNLAPRANEKVGDVIRSRGGSGANVKKAGVWADKTLKETAEAAVQGNDDAATAIKIAKEARRLGQKY